MNQVNEMMRLSMLNDMQQLNTISHNLANVSTHGYKRHIDLQQRFRLELNQLLQANNQPVQQIYTDMQTGTLQKTQDALNMAIDGAGFFALQDSNGELYYTRAGAFMRDPSGILSTHGGKKVLSRDGGVIRLSSNQPHIDLQGKIYEQDQFVAQIKIVEFNDAHQLRYINDGLFAANGQTSVMLEDDRVLVRQKYLEASNVKPMDEMVRLMETMRQFELKQKAVNIYDDAFARAIQSLASY